MGAAIALGEGGGAGAAVAEVGGVAVVVPTGVVLGAVGGAVPIALSLPVEGIAPAVLTGAVDGAVSVSLGGARWASSPTSLVPSSASRFGAL
jgi:hypothetical protein